MNYDCNLVSFIREKTVLKREERSDLQVPCWP
ncbi:hypothetical protein V6Z11_A08G105500 [Gossypium hirsutum]